MIRKFGIFFFFIVFFNTLISSEFNFSVAPTKVEIDMKRDFVSEIFLINNTDRELKLFPYFETPLEYENHSMEGMLEIFPKLIRIEPGKEKIVKIFFEKDKNFEVIKGKEYKSYIIFKELPSNKNILEKDIIILNEIGIAVFGRS
ncbi:MAG: hypothetical protein ACRCZH_07810 [Cetobacterium sp.]